MTKLGKISEQAEKFLRALAADCNIPSKQGDWLAANFRNGSVEYDAFHSDDVSAASAEIFSRSLQAIADYDPDKEGLNFGVSASTVLEYGRIGALIDPDEIVGIGVYPANGGRIRWRSITYTRASAIRRKVEAPIPSYGAAQGILHAWFKEAREPHFQLRELSTDALVRVIYPSRMYDEVAAAVRERNAILDVSGDLLYDRATRNPVEMRADRLRMVRLLSTAEFESFFGSVPDFVAEDTSETYADG
jgi:hypothetical protein